MTNENVDLVTKWLYVVQGSEAEPVRKSRKRIIYDFQFWNRGTFFPLKNFVEDIWTSSLFIVLLLMFIFTDIHIILSFCTDLILIIEFL